MFSVQNTYFFLFTYSHTTYKRMSESPLLMDFTAQQLKPYYDAIAKIRVAAEAILVAKDQEYKTKGEKFWVDNGFKGWPTPNPCYNRTNGLMFVAASYYSTGEIHDINYLVTPFGEIKITGSGMGDHISEFTNLLFHDENLWELEDVTEELRVYGCYIQEKNETRGGPYKPPKESWEGACDTLKFYVIKRVGEYTFDTTGRELCYYLSVFMKEWFKDGDIFNEVSGGKGCF